MKMSYAWAMPSPWTFSIPPIKEFCDWHSRRNDTSDHKSKMLDPFFGRSPYLVQLSNDLDPSHDADCSIDARDYLSSLQEAHRASIDVVFFDPPYSPRQISECYRRLGKKVTMADTQSAKFKRECRELIAPLLMPGGIVLSFGWNATGMGKKNGFEKVELLVVDHGGDHNSTLCLAEVKL